MTKSAQLSAFAIAVLTTAAANTAAAQDRLRTMPGYDRYVTVSSQIPSAVRSGALSVVWKDAHSFEYEAGGHYFRYELSHGATEIQAPADSANGGPARSFYPGRGRQYETMFSPDNGHRAFYRDYNLWISNPNGSGEIAVTTDGTEKSRVKYGTANWVYGEELAQNTAFWWSPDGKKLAYYRFDESKVPDYYLALDQTRFQSTLGVEAYPRPGVPTPVVDVYVYDLETRHSTRLDVRDGKPFDDAVVGHYVYRIGWTPDGSEITIHRTNRKQNVLEFAACNPMSGHCRTIIHEEWPTGWIMNRPPMQYLSDGKRFIWMSERNGYRNLYLYDLSGKLLNTITHHNFEVGDVVRVDEEDGVLFYTARDGDNHLKFQLHRVGLNGEGERRLTDPALNHSISLSPDGKYFIDVAQTHDMPPVTRLVDENGKIVTELARSDMSDFVRYGLRKTEMFTYLAADGKTELHGMISYPSNFDSTRSYPVLVPVYGGPGSTTNTSRETWTPPNPLTEYGFLVVTLDTRAAPGMGKKTMDAVYKRLGQTEIDDLAEGVRALWSRPYVDRTRVGIYGTSYGGYSSLMALLRHPDVFAAASVSSPPTDWRNYDAVYTERYMSSPDDNKAGYDSASALNYVNRLKGRLMLYYGTADNNVHPSNMMQLVSALQQAGKSFDMQIGPDRGHSGINSDRMMEFFIQALVLDAKATS